MTEIQEIVKSASAAINEKRGQPDRRWTYSNVFKMTDLAGFGYQPLIYSQMETKHFEGRVKKAVDALLHQEFSSDELNFDTEVQIDRNHYADLVVKYTWRK